MTFGKLIYEKRMAQGVSANQLTKTMQMPMDCLIHIENSDGYIIDKADLDGFIARLSLDAAKVNTVVKSLNCDKILICGMIV